MRIAYKIRSYSQPARFSDLISSCSMLCWCLRFSFYNAQYRCRFSLILSRCDYDTATAWITYQALSMAAYLNQTYNCSVGQPSARLLRHMHSTYINCLFVCFV